MMDSVCNECYPVVLFVYNRPDHTRKTLEALSNSRLSNQTSLTVFSDGAPDNASSELRGDIEKVRRIVDQENWCGEVNLIKRQRNMGLADSIRDGVSTLLQSNEAVIVLEDDIVVSQGFLEYMNTALSTYRESAKVFQVSAFMVPTKGMERLNDTGFFRAPASWGWGTWARAWKYFDDDANTLLAKISTEDRNHFDIEGTYPHIATIERNIAGEIRTWAVLWYATMYLHGALCLYPKRSLVRNIGFDGTGVHCGTDKTRLYSRMRVEKSINVSRLLNVEEDASYANAFRELYSKRFGARRPSLIRRAYSYAKRKIIRT